MTQQLADQQQRAAQAGQKLAQESVGIYMDFLNSMFSYSRDSLEATQRDSERSAGGGGSGAEAQRKARKAIKKDLGGGQEEGSSENQS